MPSLDTIKHNPSLIGDGKWPPAKPVGTETAQVPAAEEITDANGLPYISYAIYIYSRFDVHSYNLLCTIHILQPCVMQGCTTCMRPSQGCVHATSERHHNDTQACCNHAKL